MREGANVTLMSLFNKKQLKEELTHKCIFCKKILKFGEKCECLNTKERIDVLYERTMQLLKEEA